jgi:YfiH family protein
LICVPDVRLHGDPPTHLTFPALEALGLSHAVTTRHCPGITPSSDPASPFGPDFHAFFAPLGLDLSRTSYLSQVHGSDAVRVDGRGGGLAGAGDILVTRRSGLPLSVFTADCLGIILFDPGRRLLALAHVGWRGTVQGAAGKAVAALVGEGARQDEIIVAIAPSIGPCCYEVGPSVIEALRSTRPAEWELWVTARGGERWTLDLWRANESQLMAAGVPPERIVNPRLCTACHRRLFFSYRKEGSRGRLVTVASLPAAG